MRRFLSNRFARPFGCARVFQQLPDHLVGRVRVIRFVLGEQRFLRRFLVLGLLLPQHGERGVRRDQQSDRVAEVADVADDVLRAVGIAGDDDAGGLAFEGRRLARADVVVDFIEPLDHPLGFRGLAAPPDRRREDHDVGVEHLFQDAGPRIALAHVAAGSGQDAMIDQLDGLAADVLLLHPSYEEFAERLGIGQARTLERAEQYRRLHRCPPLRRSPWQRSTQAGVTGA